MKRLFKPEWRKRVPAQCVSCGRPFEAVESEIKRGRGRCCSAGCAASLAAANRDSSGAANGNWKGGVPYTESRRRYQFKHPLKHAAHREMTRAMRRGELLKQPCEVCGADKVDGHHDDYSKPLSVRWLCRRHHIEAHKGRFGS